jgi:hypothetical protein
VPIVALLVPPIASAHRLDEYLQATRIALAPDRVVLEIDLTPGVDVAPMVFALINTDRDGRISAPEAQAYAEQVLRDVILEVDGRPQHLALAGNEFPSYQEMSAGIGTIRIEARATVPTGTSGPHSLFCQNNHRPDMGVYLVNALAPASRQIEITEQHRDVRQRGIRLGFNVTFAATRPMLPPLLLIAGLVFSTLVAYGYKLYKRRSRTKAAESAASLREDPRLP